MECIDLISFTFWDDEASGSDFPVCSGDLFLHPDTLAVLVLEHISGYDFYLDLIHQLPHTEDQMDVIVGLCPVVMQCGRNSGRTETFCPGIIPI